MEPGRPLTRDEARALDANAQSRFAIPGEVLMENAGAQVARISAAFAAERGLSRAVVLCGPGNNGGDGFVAARHLVDELALDVFLLGDRERVRGDALRNLIRFEKVGGTVRSLGDASTLAACLAAGRPSLVIDALFGIGLDRPLTGLALDVVDTVNAAQRDVIAVDVPSGLDADTGEELGAAIRAVVTISFVAAKVGFERGAGPSRCGRIAVVPIGFPRGVTSA